MIDGNTIRITDAQACVIGGPETYSDGCVLAFVRVYTDEGAVSTGECSSAAAGASGFADKAAVPNSLVLEFHGCEIPCWSGLCRRGKPLVQDGIMRVPERHGNGSELDDDVARSLLWNGDTSFH